MSLKAFRCVACIVVMLTVVLLAAEAREMPWNARICKSRVSSSSPFITGDYITEKTVSRLTVFDAEILHGMRKVGSWEKAGKDSEEKSVSLVNILTFMESSGSINWSQWHGWGVGLIADTAQEIRMTCNYFPGLSPGNRAHEPIWKGNASTIDGATFMSIHCPLPPKDEFGELFENIENFQIQLKLANETNRILHIEPLPICKYDGIVSAPEASHSQVLAQTTDEISVKGKPYTSHRKLAGLHSVPLKYKQNNEEPKDKKFNVLPQSNVSVSLCIRAYHDHNLFESKRTTHSSARLIEFLDYHFLLGVNRIYFYDRYGTEMLDTLQPYVERGLVIHVPFPEWSEVYYRKDLYQGKAKDPYNFPMIYDQVLNYEACMMEGRRNNEDWMMFVDTDEFFWSPSQEVSKIPHQLENLRKEHEEKHAGSSVASIKMHRVNFLGADNSGEIFLKSSFERCEGYLVDVFKHKGKVTEVRSKAKIAARPHEMLGAQVQVHTVTGLKKGRMIEADFNKVRINHYKTASKKQLFGMKPEECQDIGDPEKVTSRTLKDESLFWAANLLQLCSHQKACDVFTSGECGYLCRESTNKTKQ